MFKGILRMTVGLCIVSLLGCNCATRRYVEVKDRVDQDMTGNAGFISGTPRPEDRSHLKKTRKVYVLEIEMKDKKKVEEAKVVAEKSASAAQSAAPAAVSFPQGYTMPIAPSVDHSVSASTPAEYTVAKGDTLQKISKKYYDTYRKWNKIYEANKEKIKNPNHVVAGTVLSIPK